MNHSLNGLSAEEALKRLKNYGPNVLSEKRISPILKFLNYLIGPIPLMIEVAIILSALTKRWEDFWIISLLLFVNVVVAFWQENKAQNAIELLKKRLALKARVLRDGNWQEIESSGLVPGDILKLRMGDIVPADAKLLQGDFLTLDESVITGESLPIEKKAADIVYSGSIVSYGEMLGQVTQTGKRTLFGQTAKLSEKSKETSHLQKAIIAIGKYLVFFVVALVTIIFVVSIVRGENFGEILQFALVLIIAAIPAALPAVLTVTLAVGSIIMAKKQAIVSRLASIEEIAGMDLIFSDKTGTITQNQITVSLIKPMANFTQEDVVLFGALASKKENRDPIDSAIINKNQQDLNNFNILHFQPFDSTRKKTLATVQEGSDNFKVAKGAPQIISQMADVASEKINLEILKMAKKGFRTLAVARTVNGVWKMVGLLGLSDPPRSDSLATISQLKMMGIDLKMITGDHLAIAQEIARQVHLDGKIELPNIKNINEDTAGFAQVLPEDKFKLVKFFQSKNHIVGMTGDGVNDAPALKQADVGIAVDSATDVAKTSADIVFARAGLNIIVEAIQESRKIFRRMNSYAIYRVAETIRLLLFLSLSILVFRFYPITAIMIVLLALLNDFPIMMIAYDKTDIPERPVRWQMNRVLILATILGILGVFSSFLLLIIGKNLLHLDNATLQTLVFLKLTVAGHLTIYLARTGDKPFWSRPLPSPLLFFTTETTQIIATIFAVLGIFMHPLGWSLALLVWLFALVFFFLNDYIKVHILKFFNW